MQYITIPNFDEFQSYHDGRKIKWVKLLIDIIEEFDNTGSPKKFYHLPDSAKLTFLTLLCFAPRYSGRIPYKNNGWLKEQLGIKKLDLQPLAKKGFIEISKPCTDSVQNCTNFHTATHEIEIEIEKEIETERGVRFENFWKIYPKKVGKGAAKKSFEKINPPQELFEKMLTAIDRWKKSQAWKKDGGQYIPYPATWLNQGRWDDEFENPKPAIPESRRCPKCQRPLNSSGECFCGYGRQT